ncbi:tetratricopeptide repeat protein [Yoonia litorea]|uniref:Tfp pilus assembly protein PilF n=1 Tax=Yoonia litorea TaxID=1123755 RepID=A0A1I6L4I2_9RHOB|nr:tetratricopeptide repeat protein [Yoonia litorea]SFR98385.1 Tfp pilus assembly protein PilF [Yoonia litorea]
MKKTGKGGPVRPVFPTAGAAPRAQNPMNALIALYQQGKFAEVIAQAAPLAKANPQVFALWNLLGASYAQSGKMDQAKAAFTRAAKLKPDHPDPHNNLGNVLRASGDTAQAIASYKKALACDAKYAQAHNNLGAIYLDQGKVTQAEEHLKTALKLVPTYAEAHNNLGNLSYRNGDHQRASEAYLAATKHNPKFAEAHFNIGVLAQAQGTFDKAERAYLTALQIRPTHADAMRNLGVVLQKRGDLAKAIAATRRATELAPKDTESHINLGLFHGENNAYREALDSFETALRLSPSSMRARLGKADVLLEMNRLTAAHDVLADAHNAQPEAIEPVANLGLVLQRLGRHEEAARLYEDAINRHPDASALRVNLGLIYEDLNQWQKASEMFAEALSVEPSNNTAARMLAKLPKALVDDTRLDQLDTFHRDHIETIARDSSRLFFEADLDRLRGNIDDAFSKIEQANAARLDQNDNGDGDDASDLTGVRDRLRSWTPVTATVEPAVKPVFILGPSRSGKSVLEYLLAQSGNVNPLYEPIRTMPQAEREASFDSMFYASEDTLRAHGVELATSTNPHVLAHITAVADAFPAAAFVFVKRNPLDLGADIFATEYGRGNTYAYDPAKLVSYLNLYNEIAEAFLAKAGARAMAVSYDDILNHPEKVILKIGDHVGMPIAAKATVPETLPAKSVYREAFKAVLEREGLERPHEIRE